MLFALVSTLALAAGPEAAPQAVTLRGVVIPLADALKPANLVVDAGPIAQQVVLRGEDGTITPLLSDEGSRALFADERLRNRPVELQARRFPGLPYVQVTAFKVEDQGTLRTPEYYCDVCTISVRFPQACPCCQGPMELRMKPEEP
jgi:hypothetical protein